MTITQNQRPPSKVLVAHTSKQMATILAKIYFIYHTVKESTKNLAYSKCKAHVIYFTLLKKHKELTSKQIQGTCHIFQILEEITTYLEWMTIKQLNLIPYTWKCGLIVWQSPTMDEKSTKKPQVQSHELTHSLCKQHILSQKILTLCTSMPHTRKLKLYPKPSCFTTKEWISLYKFMCTCPNYRKMYFANTSARGK